MAKKTLLQLVNSVLRKVVQTEVTSVVSAVGHAQIVVGLINDAQRQLYAQANWHSLLTSRNISVTSGLDTYALASDHGKTLILKDISNNRKLEEGTPLVFGLVDPGALQTGPPTHFGVSGNNYQLFPIPSSSVTLSDNYFKYPSTLALDASTSDLPIECESCLEFWALSELCSGHMNNFERGTWALNQYKTALSAALMVNREKINRILSMVSDYPTPSRALLPTWPSSYGREVDF